jgi:AcrR family transcriptional regulator
MANRRGSRRSPVMAAPGRLTHTGPRLNPALSDEIIKAATALLAEVGYDAMSMEAIAARAGVGKATIYRRWSGKALLVLDSVRARELPLDDPPDTGDLRDDLLTLFGELAACLDEQALAHLSGVLVAMRRDPELRDTVNDLILDAWARATRAIVVHAAERGEIARRSEDVVDLFAKVGPSVLALHYLTAKGAIDEPLVTHLVDEILLPILQCA